MLGYLLTLIATVYALYTFVLGAPVLGKSSSERRSRFTLVVVLSALMPCSRPMTSFVFSGSDDDAAAAG